VRPTRLGLTDVLPCGPGDARRAADRWPAASECSQTGRLGTPSLDFQGFSPRSGGGSWRTATFQPTRTTTRSDPRRTCGQRFSEEVTQELADILDEVRAQIARGVEPDVAALEERVQALDPKALPRLRRLLAVHRAKRSLREPARPTPVPGPRTAPPTYRAKPTIAANMAVRTRANGDAVALEWDAPRGVDAWEVRVGERRDARSQYVDRETVQLAKPSYQLELTDLPLRVSVTGRNASGRIVQRALISGLTRSNWRQKWQQRASAS
jgi:hypothetical protein